MLPFWVTAGGREVERHSLADPEVHTLDRLVVYEIGRRRLVDDGALAHDVGVVGHAHGHAEVLLHQEDGLPRLLELCDHPEDLVDHHGGQALRRLVEQQQIGVGHERAGDGEHLLLAAGQEVTLVLTPFFQLGEDLEHLLQGPGILLAAGARSHGQVLGHGERREDHSALGDEADAQTSDLEGRKTDQFLAVEDDAALARGREAHDGADGGGLAHAIPTQQGDDGGVLHLEGDSLQDVGVAVPGMDVVDLEHPRSPTLPGSTAHVDVPDHRVGSDLLTGALAGDLAIVQQYHPVGDPEDQVHIVGDHQHGDLRAQRPDARGDVGALGGRQPATGLVQQQQFGVAGQAEGDLQFALLAIGKRTHDLVAQFPYAGRFEQFLGGGLQLLDLHE